MVKPKIKIKINPGSPSPQFHFLGGNFAFGKTSIPFLTAHMTVSQIDKCLKTPIELPGWNEGETELEALFQRQLDHRRVQDKLLPYLYSESIERPRFFNALTIALVPHRDHSFVSYNDDDFSPPSLVESGTEYTKSVGPVTLGFYEDFDASAPDTYAIGEFRWNLDETVAVAIDGQHRLAALKKVHKLNPTGAQFARVCVIFILPAEALGYKGPKTKDGSALLKLLRSVFIDLNKHAKAVKRTRLILLDDMDPHCMVVRRLIGERLRNVSSADPSDGDRLPLALVDWHSDEAKFDQGPYVTSVMMLDRIVQLLLGVNAVMDWSKRTDVERQLAAFKRLGYEPTDECDRRLNSFLAAEEAWQESFSYPEDDLKRIAGAVGSAYAPVITKIITELEPYRELIVHREENAMLSTMFSDWYEAYSSLDGTQDAQIGLAGVQERIRKSPNPPNISAWKNFLENEVPEHKEKCLFFKVVFQGAMFESLGELKCVEFPVLKNEVELPTPGSAEHLQRWASRLVIALNGLLSADEHFFDLTYAFRKDGGQVTFWAGSVFNISNSRVDYTKAGLYRTSFWLNLILLLWEAADAWIDAGLGNLPAKHSKFIDGLGDEDADYHQKVTRECKRVEVNNSGNQGAMTRLARAIIQDEDDEDAIEEEASRQLDLRLRQVWRFIRNAIA